ncbi:MAG TPA: DUF945 family protein [Casimicrobiaceae bacterium]|jgi:hypothetical protein
MRAKGWVGLLIAVSVVAAIVPNVTGRMTESRVRELVAAANQTWSSSWKVEIDSYDRSWARSESVVRIRSGEGTDVAELRTTWRHGPLGGMNLASGSTEFHLLGPLAASERHYFKGNPPATATHTVSLDQSLRADFATPPIDRALMDSPATRVSGTGSSGTLTIDRSGRFAFDHHYPKLTIAERAEKLEIVEARLASSGSFGDAALATPAQFSLSAGSIQWSDKLRSVAIADVSITGRMIPNAESIDFKFGHVVGPGHAEERGNAHRWKRIELRLTFADISRAALEGLSREMRSVSELPPSDPRRLQLSLSAFANASQALLKRDPTLSLDTFTFEGPDGILSITATVRVDQALLKDGGFAPLLRAISMLARVSIARALAEAWLVAALRPNAVAALTVQGSPEPSAADVDRWARTMAGNVLGSAAQAGLIREGADPIVVEIVAKEGRILANGLSAERLAELKSALLPDPAARNRGMERVPAAPGTR